MEPSTDTSDRRRPRRWRGAWGPRSSSSGTTMIPCWTTRFANYMLEQTWWSKGVMIVAAMILLFLAQVHDLVFPPASDVYMDVICLLCFACCTADILFRCVATSAEHGTSGTSRSSSSSSSSSQSYCPGYWKVPAATEEPNTPQPNTSANSNTTNSNHNARKSMLSSSLQIGTSSHALEDAHATTNETRHAAHAWTFSVGSFLFWCDVLSTLTLLTDVSFINVYNFSERHVHIALSPWGFPIKGMESVNQPRPIELNFMLLVTICQSARLARFIRSTRTVKMSSKVNWFMLVNFVNPAWWWQRLCGRKVTQVSGGPTANGTDVASATTMALVPDSATGPFAEHEAAGASSKSLSSRVSKPAPGAYARVWQWLGRSPLDSPEYCRQLAATKIQRAWRAVVHEREMMDSYHCISGEFSAHLAPHGSRNALTASLRSNAVTAPAPAAIGSHHSPNPTHHRRNESQVGTAMRELTEQRVAIGIMVALLLTVFFTYTEENATRPTAMIVLHNQTGTDAFANKSLVAARSSSIPDLYWYQLANGQTRSFDVNEHGTPPADLRPRERLRISVHDAYNRTTVGLFSYRNERLEQAWVSLLSTIFILLVWFFGVTAFAGPVMMLVVIPIERMVRLLAMLMVDPLGYQSTPRYKRFVDEEDEITKNTRWTKEILKGMETSFLMSTILRIGSLMKVGFGSAGVEIIRNNLEKGQNKNMLVLSSQGSTVSCIFLFCDIRNFTDATECLQEEVFVFTNRIAAVVHSNCHALGGSANKNVGDAFLLSWQLDEKSGSADIDDDFNMRKGSETFTAKSNQADKALLAVVRICQALHYDDYYIGTMTETARQALVTKLKQRKGPIVQMGFGLHAGRAVQGAIGSQRKIDATYVSEAVERAEFLESSTKQYGLNMLMSNSFHRLLHPSNRRRCRKVDQILIREDDDDDDDGQVSGDIMDLFTFDLDVNALWSNDKKTKSEKGGDDSVSEGGSKRAAMSKIPRGRRMSMRLGLPIPQDDSMVTDEVSQSGFLGVTSSGPIVADAADNEDGKPSMKLVLPTGPALYNANVWTSEDMRTMRQLYSDGLFFQKYMSGLQAYYSKDWDHATLCFSAIVQRFEDGPSRFFLNQIEKHNGKPPRDFLGYGTAS